MAGGGQGRTCALALCMDELNSVPALSALSLTARPQVVGAARLQDGFRVKPGGWRATI